MQPLVSGEVCGHPELAQVGAGFGLSLQRVRGDLSIPTCGDCWACSAVYTFGHIKPIPENYPHLLGPFGTFLFYSCTVWQSTGNGVTWRGQHGVQRTVWGAGGSAWVLSILTSGGGVPCCPVAVPAEGQLVTFLSL